jgi:hypothetical protein
MKKPPNIPKLKNSDHVCRIAGKDKPMGRLVGEAFIEQVGRVMDYIIEDEPALADTLAIMLDDGIRSAIEQGRKEWAQGERIPLKAALDKSCWHG